MARKALLFANTAGVATEPRSSRRIDSEELISENKPPLTFPDEPPAFTPSVFNRTLGRCSKTAGV
jgi:hypothetical protein